MKNTQNLTIDINKKPFQTITANTGEVASRFVRISIIDKSTPVDLTGVTVSLYAKKPDGNKVFNNVTIEDKTNGIILAELTSQILAEEGLVKLTLLLVKNNAKLCTKQFLLNVDKSIIDDEAIESSNEFGALTEALSKADEWNGYFEETSGKIEEKYTERLNDVRSQLEHIENSKQEVINIKKMFGAKGDNKTDDTQAFINAIEYGKNNNCTVFYLPQGKYLISDTIRIDFDGFTLIGDGNNLNGNNSSIIYRTKDTTIFHVGGEPTLEKYTNVSNPVFKNLAFRDKADTYTNNPFFKFHYVNWLLIEECVMTIYNCAIDTKQLYDSRIVNCDIGTGGNQDLDIALITLHGGRNASNTEIGWDGTNTLMIYGCKFERYRGTVIRTTDEEQPSTTNTVNPNIAKNVNTIRIEMSRFESPYLTKKPIFDFNYTNGIYLNTQITVLDGQTDLECVMKCNNVKGLYGLLKVNYYTTTVEHGVVYQDFSNPCIKLVNSGFIDLTLHPVTTQRYKLDYFVEVQANDNTYRSVNINIPISYTKKKIYNNSSIPLNLGKQGKQMTYGENGNNGFVYRYDNTIQDEYGVNSQFINSKHYLRRSYKLNSNSTTYIEDIISDTNGSYKNNNMPNVFANGLIVGSTLGNADLNCYNNGIRTGRLILFMNSLPTDSTIIFKKGDIVFNTACSSGGYVGWVCVTGGNPGTWKGFGLIES